ncbi:MAG: ABC transporter substrate-binding protein, partial [Pseudomonadota bacterium]
WEGAPAVGGGAYANVQAILGVEDVDPYSAQTYDHASLTILAMAAGGAATGDTVRANVRTISQGDGTVVESAVDGLAALDGGINYQGASGPCDFDEIGDITGTSFIFKSISGAAPSDYKRV